jgi:hypothetical protein
MVQVRIRSQLTSMSWCPVDSDRIEGQLKEIGENAEKKRSEVRLRFSSFFQVTVSLSQLDNGQADVYVYGGLRYRS